VDADGHAEDDDLRRWVDRASPTPPRYRPSNRASYQHAERKPAATARPAGHFKAASHKGVTQDAQKVCPSPLVVLHDLGGRAVMHQAHGRRAVLLDEVDLDSRAR
jgi:hypothetical protein